MIRVVIFLCAVGILALGAGWIADRPGDVQIVWLEHRIDTSVSVLIAAAALLAALAIALWTVLRALIASPGNLRRRWRERRIAKGRRAIADGLIAVGAGDVHAAVRHAADARRLANGEPLALLLGAQSAQLAGDRAAAERTFGVMAGRADMKLIGLHGLYIEARRRGDAVAARGLAEEAAETAPALGWAGRAVLEFRCGAGDWSGALAALDRNMANDLVEKPAYRRQRAVLLTAQALALLDSERDRARALALEAAKLAPDLVPAAALAGRFLSEADDPRRAARILEAAWQANPHPDIAAAYMNLRPSDSARERLARIQKLTRNSAGNVESALALARAALDAQDFAAARAALKPLTITPTQRVALLMAELEQAESGDIGRAREWTARAVHAARDPAWTADGFVSDVWLPVSPSGRIDAFVWKVPVAELPGPAIEAERAAPVPVTPALPPAPAAVVAPDAAPAPKPDDPAASPEADASAAPAAPGEPSAQAAPPPVPARPAGEPIIPLVHAPDDPGPDAAPDPDAAAAGNGWWRPRGR